MEERHTCYYCAQQIINERTYTLPGTGPKQQCGKHEYNPKKHGKDERKEMETNYARILRDYDRQKKRRRRQIVAGLLVAIMISTVLVGVISLYEKFPVTTSEVTVQGDFERLELVHRKLSNGISYEGDTFAIWTENGTQTIKTGVKEGTTLRLYIFIYKDGNRQTIEEVTTGGTEKTVTYGNLTVTFNIANILRERARHLIPNGFEFTAFLIVLIISSVAITFFTSQHSQHEWAREAYEELKRQQ